MDQEEPKEKLSGKDIAEIVFEAITAIAALIAAIKS